MEFISVIIDTLLNLAKSLGGGFHGLNSLLGDFLSSSSDSPVVPEPEAPTSIPLVPLEPATPIIPEVPEVPEVDPEV